MARIISIEPTPNPMAFQIRLDQKLTLGGTRQYSKKAEAFDSPVAQRLFDVHGVDTVFFADETLTISKTPAGIWDFIFFQAHEILMAAKEIVPIKGDGGGASASTASLEDFDQLNGEQKLSLINQIIDESIRPGLARDGGGLEIMGLDGNTVRVKYQGACGSCPSSTAGTLNYISNLLQSKVSPNLTVMPV